MPDSSVVKRGWNYCSCDWHKHWRFHWTMRKLENLFHVRNEGNFFQGFTAVLAFDTEQRPIMSNCRALVAIVDIRRNRRQKIKKLKTKQFADDKYLIGGKIGDKIGDYSSNTNGILITT